MTNLEIGVRAQAIRMRWLASREREKKHVTCDMFDAATADGAAKAFEQCGEIIDAWCAEVFPQGEEKSDAPATD